VLQELLDREGLHHFLRGCSAHRTPGGRTPAPMQTVRLPIADTFSIWSSDFPMMSSSGARGAASDELSYKLWTLRIRIKLADVLQATCIGASAVTETQCQKLWKLPELVDVISMPFATSITEVRQDTQHNASQTGGGKESQDKARKATLRAKGVFGPLWDHLGAKRTAVQYM
jgi:hypothetical protein